MAALYAPVRLADHTLIGAPGPLPYCVANWHDAEVADLDAMGLDPVFGHAGTGFWPVVITTPAFDPTTHALTGTATLSAPNPATRTVPATANVRALTADEIGTAVAAARSFKLADLPTLANQTAGNASLALLDTKATANNAKLNTLIGQAAPVSVPGTSIGATIGVTGVQGVTGGVPLPISGTVTTQSGTALATPAYRIGLAAAGNNAQVFTPPGVVTPKKMLHAYFCNKATADRVVKFYDKSKAPVPGTDTVVTSIFAPAGACPVIDFSTGGFPFVNGLAVAITASGDGDTGSTLAAGDVAGLIIQHN